MPAVFEPKDSEVRKRITECLDETILVEAGAGTGKTHSLVGRVASLIRKGCTTLDRIAAITFTEAAAAELRDRVRETLEKLAEASDTSPEERQRCEQGVRDLDQSAIQTLHSFAASILRERPLEAGLPPAFDTLDEIQADTRFKEAWVLWLDSALEDPSLVPHLRSAMSLELTLAHLREAAKEFHASYDLVSEADFSDTPPPDMRGLVARLSAAAPELERLLAFAHDGDADKLAAHVQTALRTIRRLGAAGPDSIAMRRLLAQSPRLSTTRGNKKDWDDDPISGENACTRAKRILSNLDEAMQQTLTEARQAALMPLLRAIKGFVLDYARQRKAEGVAEFHDLLAWARDLLRDNIKVRDYFRRRYTHVLIDEFQDTDPIQAEIALFLTEDAAPSTPPQLRPRHWKQVRPAPGKLFVVGDSKQSIYRFRRADITVLQSLREVTGQEPLQLTQNFRSQRPIIGWINHVFERWIQPGPSQPAYIPLDHRWEPCAGPAVQPAVRYMGGAMEDVKAVDQVRREEAQSIALLARRIQSEQWPVLDSEATDVAGQERFRCARYSDICILMPRRTGLRVLELALEDANVPYRLESASLVFDSQEVRDLLNCLRAIDNPADQVSVVAALRSPAFACSDVELLEFVEAGGRFDYLSPGEAPSGYVTSSMHALAQYHALRLWLPPCELIHRFVRERRLLELALDHPRPRERWRRYDFLIERARAFAEAGDASLRGFIGWADEQVQEGARMAEAPVPDADEDAVRVMTVHAAKGLEFPVVILAGLNGEPRPQTQRLIIDRATGMAEVRLGSEKISFQTPGYEQLSQTEKQRQQEEDVRLMYVAATRARDHLIVSLYRTGKDAASHAFHIARHLDGHDHLWQQAPDGLPLHDAAHINVDGAPADDDTPEMRQQWIVERKRVLNHAERPASVAATTLARELKEEQAAPEEPWRRGRAGTSVGRAVHAVLQSIDLAAGIGLSETARAQAAAEGIPGREADIVRLVRRALDSDAVRRAVASRRWWREVPVAAPIANGVLDGFIDLLFEEDGELVIVDYKTDALETEEEIHAAMQRYCIQGGAYAAALRKAMGRSVKEVRFLFLEPHLEKAVEDLAQAMADAEEAAVAVVGERYSQA